MESIAAATALRCADEAAGSCVDGFRCSASAFAAAALAAAVSAAASSSGSAKGLEPSQQWKAEPCGHRAKRNFDRRLACVVVPRATCRRPAGGVGARSCGDGFAAQAQPQRDAWSAAIGLRAAGKVEDWGRLHDAWRGWRGGTRAAVLTSGPRRRQEVGCWPGPHIQWWKRPQDVVSALPAADSAVEKASSVHTVYEHKTLTRRNGNRP